MLRSNLEGCTLADRERANIAALSASAKLSWSSEVRLRSEKEGNSSGHVAKTSSSDRSLASFFWTHETRLRLVRSDASWCRKRVVTRIPV